MNRINILLILTMIFLTVIKQGCQEAKDNSGSADQNQIFPEGQLAPAKFFTGNAYVTGLVDNDSVFTMAAGNVFFKAGARSNWHLHPCGQILLVTSGVGYHQIKGQPIAIIRKGDVVQCPPMSDIGTALPKRAACLISTFCQIPRKVWWNGKSL